MPCKKCESSAIVYKNILPIIDLSEGSNKTTDITLNSSTKETLERHLDNNDTLLNLKDYSLNNEYFNNEDDDSTIQFNNKWKNNDIKKETDLQKKIRMFIDHLLLLLYFSKLTTLYRSTIKTGLHQHSVICRTCKIDWSL